MNEFNQNLDFHKTLQEISTRDVFKLKDKWINSKNIEIKKIRLGPRGDLIEEWIDKICKFLGFNVISEDTRIGEHDTTIGNKKFEIKMATEDVGGKFQFNLIRIDYEYDFLLCLGIAPNDIWFNVYRHEDVASMNEGIYKLDGCTDSVLPGHMSKFRTESNTLNYKLTKKPDELRSIEELPLVLSSLGISVSPKNASNLGADFQQQLIELVRKENYQKPFKKWSDSNFKNIYLAENTATGKIGEIFIDEISRSLGFNVNDDVSYTGEYDAIINNKKIEIKTACLGVNNAYQFNNVRDKYEYDFLLCLGIAPNDIWFNVYRHEDVKSREEGIYKLDGCTDSVLPGLMTPMAKKAKHEDNYKLNKIPSELRSMDEFQKVLTAILN